MNDNIEDKELESSASEGENQSTTPVDNKADEASREPSDAGNAPRKPTRRELLVKELSQPSAKDEVDETEDEDADEQEAVDDKAPKGEAESQDTEGTAKSGEEEKDLSQHDTSDRRSKAKIAFEKLTTHNRELKTKLDEAQPFAEYGKSMFNYCKDAGISTEKLGLWLTVAADAEKNPSAARTHLEKLGIKIDPVREVVHQIPQELEDTLLDMTTNGQVAPEAFKALRDMIRKAKATAPAPGPSAVQNPPPAAVQTSAPSAAPRAIDPRKAEYDRDLAKAVADINAREDELATKYPADWPKMKEVIAKGFSRYRGTDPKLWASFFEDELNKVIAKAKRQSTPASAPLRPSSNSSAPKAPPSKIAALKADIVAGKIR